MTMPPLHCSRFLRRLAAVLFAIRLTSAIALAASEGLQVDAAKGVWSYLRGGTGVEGSLLSVEADGSVRRLEGGKWSGEVLSGTLSGTSVSWQVRFHPNADGSLTVSSDLKNTGPRAVRLGRVRLADGTAPLPGDVLVLSMTGWQAPSAVKRADVSGERINSKILTQVVSGTRAVQIGFTSFDRANAEHSVWQEAGRLRVESWCDFAGWALSPGQTTASETLRLAIPTDPLRGLEEWADAAAAHYRPDIWKEPVAGWLGWSWVDPFHSETYESVVARNAQAVRRRLPGLKIDYIWVSLGNLDRRLPGNWLNWNRDRFPGGREKLVETLGALNFRLGLWAGAFWLNSQLTQEVAELQDAFLRKDGKPLTVAHRELGAMYLLDPTHPKTRAWLTKTFLTYREWGIRYYMVDFLDSIGGATPGTYMPDGYFDKSVVPGPEAFRRGIAIVKEAAGKDTYLLASTGPSLLGTGIMDAARAGSDYGEGRALDGPGKGFYPGTFVINNPNYWTSHRRATEALATHFFLHKRLFVADTVNVLTVDKPISVADAQISATLFGLGAGPVMLGDDIDRISDDRLEIIKKILPAGQEIARPLDLFEAPPSGAKQTDPHVFRVTVRKDWDTWDVLAVFNFGSDALRRKIELNGENVVWDFWNERSVGQHKASWEALVMPESVRLIRVTKARPHPWVVGTDMHVRQGEMELEQVRWDEAGGALTIKAARPEGYTGNVYVRAPEGWAVKEPAGLWLARDGSDGSMTVRVALRFDAQGKAERTIRFERFENKAATGRAQ